MIKFSFELLVNTSPEKVWKLYADINEWYKWDSKFSDVPKAVLSIKELMEN